MGIRSYETAFKILKETINMSRTATNWLTYTDFYPANRRATDSDWQRKWKMNTASYIIKHLALKNGKVPIKVKLNMLCIGHTKLTLIK